ncbi:MAG: TetR/AcrR family transcriptional regulator, partial [Ruoffia tabacinasalis]
METKIDPRVARTRKAIIESFIQLSERKPFENISVKDITEEALINRATFYNHFLDKYDLMEKALFEDVQLKLNREEYSEVQLNEDYIVSL